MTFRSSRRSRRHRTPRPQEDQPQPFFSKAGKATVQTKEDTAFFQPKLTIGQPGDQYEQEADAMADAVVNHGGSPATVQEKAQGIQKMDSSRMEEDRKIQEKSLQMQEEEEVQMQAEEEEEVQMQAEEEEEVQMQAEEEEEEMQMQAEEEEEMQMKSSDPQASRTAGARLTRQVRDSAGKGRPLPKPARTKMESAFGVDFSGVRIHTDAEAVAMNKQLGAQAFTHGRDIYFNTGKFHPDTSRGKELLAHELTHVVQQNKDQIQKKEAAGHHRAVVQMDDEEKVLDFEAIKKVLEQIPTGKEALKQKEDMKVEVEFKKGGGSYHQNGKLVIDSSHTPERAALAFVHEMNHAYYYHKKLRVNIRETTREEYVDGKVKEEAEGVVKSIEAKIELEGTSVDTKGLSYPLEKEYRETFDKVIKEGKGKGDKAVDMEALQAKARAEGKKRVIKGFMDGEVVTSTTGESYPDYYGAAWDKVHAKKK